MQTSLNRALNKHVVSIIPAHISRPCLHCHWQNPLSLAHHTYIHRIRKRSCNSTKGLNIQFLVWIRPADKFYLALSNCMNLYTQLWREQECSTEIQDTMSAQNHTKVPNSVQDHRCSKIPHKGHLVKYQASSWDNYITGVLIQT